MPLISIGLGQSKRPKSCTYTNQAYLSLSLLSLSLSITFWSGICWLIFVMQTARVCNLVCKPRNFKGNVSKCDALVNIVSLCKFKGQISSIWVPICPNHQPLDRSAIFCSQPPGSSWFQKATDLELDSSRVQPFRVFSSHLHCFTPTSCNEWITDHGWAMLSLRCIRHMKEWRDMNDIVTWHWWSPGIFSLDISWAIPIPFHFWATARGAVALLEQRLGSVRPWWFF